MRDPLRKFYIFGALITLSLVVLIAINTPGLRVQARARPTGEHSSAHLQPHKTGRGVTRASKDGNQPQLARPRVVLYDQYDNPDPFESGTSSQVFGAPWSD